MPIRTLHSWLASRARTRPPSTIVLHATGGDSAVGAIDWLRSLGLSYHYVIAQDGTVTKCVPVSRVAFHAGESDGPEGPRVNEYSVGISLVNRNDGKTPYTPEQYRECHHLIATLCAAKPTLRWLTTHAAIAPKRKTDPRGFDFRQVAIPGLRLWGVK